MFSLLWSQSWLLDSIFLLDVSIKISSPFRSAIIKEKLRVFINCGPWNYIILQNFIESFSFSGSPGTCSPVLRAFHRGIDRRLDAMLPSGNSPRSRRFVSFVVLELRDTAAWNPWGGRGEGKKWGSKKMRPWERSCLKVYSAIIPRILIWVTVLRKYYLL